MQCQYQPDLEGHSNSSGNPRETLYQELRPIEDYEGGGPEGFEDLCEFGDLKAGFPALVRDAKATSPGEIVGYSQQTLEKATQ